MNTEYLRTAKKSFMIVKNACFPYENYELQMIMKNEIPSLLKFQIIVGDGVVEYWYDVTGMQSLNRQFLLEQADSKQVRRILMGLIDMKYDMEQYLLDDHNISFLTEMIYYDRFTDKLRFCYVPGLSGETGYEIKNLFEELLPHLNHSDPVAVRIGYEMYERCVGAEFVVEDCRECLRKYDGRTEWEEQIDRTLQRAETGAFSEKEPYENLYSQELFDLDSAPEVRRQRKRLRKRRKKKKNVLYHRYLDEEQDVSMAAEDYHSSFAKEDKSGHTQYFAPEDLEDSWELIYKGDGLENDIPMRSFPFFLGSDSNKVQGVLQARTVSRIHAGFFMKEGKLYLEDYNSTNGTYLNQRLLPMNTPAEVYSGDHVVLATEEFTISCTKQPKQYAR